MGIKYFGLQHYGDEKPVAILNIDGYEGISDMNFLMRLSCVGLASTSYIDQDYFSQRISGAIAQQLATLKPK